MNPNPSRQKKTYPTELYIWVNMTGTLRKNEIKAVVFNLALLDAARFDETGDFTANLVFSALGPLYFDTNHLKENPSVKQSNVISHMNEEFPPAFISDGNKGMFTDQAFNLDKRMTELSIPHMFNYYEKNEVLLKHGYELNFKNPYVQENLSKVSDFIDRITR